MVVLVVSVWVVGVDGLIGFGGLCLITSFGGSFDCRGRGTGLGLEFK